MKKRIILFVIHSLITTLYSQYPSAGYSLKNTLKNYYNQEYQENEDRFICCNNNNFNYSLLGVFDGHGGAEVSELLKNEAHLHLNLYLDQSEFTITESLRKVIVIPAKKVAQEKIEGGSTAVVCLIHDNTLYTAHVGDSRAALCSGNKVTFLTEDHKPIPGSKEYKRIAQRGGCIEILTGIQSTKSEWAECMFHERRIFKDNVVVESVKIAASDDSMIFHNEGLNQVCEALEHHKNNESTQFNEIFGDDAKVFEIYRVLEPQGNYYELNCRSLSLSRSVGDFSFKQCGVIHEPTLYEQKLPQDAQFLIVGSHGFWDAVIDKQILVELVTRFKETDTSPDYISQQLCLWAQEQGSRDDITVVYSELASSLFEDELEDIELDEILIVPEPPERTERPQNNNHKPCCYACNTF